MVTLPAQHVHGNAWSRGPKRRREAFTHNRKCHHQRGEFNETFPYLSHFLLGAWKRSIRLVSAIFPRPQLFICVNLALKALSTRKPTDWWVMASQAGSVRKAAHPQSWKPLHQLAKVLHVGTREECSRKLRARHFLFCWNCVKVVILLAAWQLVY